MSIGSQSSQLRRIISRRKFLTLAGGATAVLLTGYRPTTVFADGGTGTTLTPQQALNKLMEGNQRYLDAKTTHPDQTADRRIEVAKSQAPFAVILTCSDSRVAPEILFDQGLGDIFVLRTAGNVLADVVTGSIEYAVAELKAPLVMVLGHERCGAVSAAVDVVTKGTKLPGKIGSLAKAIQPAVDAVKNQSGDMVDNAVKKNAQLAALELEKTEPILSDGFTSHHVMFVAARYDLDDGKVELLPLE